MANVTENAPKDAPRPPGKMSKEWEEVVEKVMKQNEEALRRLSKL